MPLEFILEPPPNFVLETVVCGHGWYDLLPFRWNPELRSLAYVFQSSNGKKAASGSITDDEGNLTIAIDKAVINKEKIERDVRHILRMDEDMGEFYGIAADVAGTRWVSAIGAGRMLRSATVFEDMVKTMCTTNCSCAYCTASHTDASSARRAGIGNRARSHQTSRRSPSTSSIANQGTPSSVTPPSMSDAM
jgi:hypothetical protein